MEIVAALFLLFFDFFLRPIGRMTVKLTFSSMFSFNLRSNTCSAKQAAEEYMEPVPSKKINSVHAHL